MDMQNSVIDRLQPRPNETVIGSLLAVEKRPRTAAHNPGAKGAPNAGLEAVIPNLMLLAGVSALGSESPVRAPALGSSRGRPRARGRTRRPPTADRPRSVRT